MKDSERLKHTCPECNAKPGDPCRLYNLKPTEKPHRTRGPGEYEKHLTKEISRKVSRQKASYGPLFQEIADREVFAPSVDEMKWKKRMEAAFGAESASLCEQANRGLEWVRLWHIVRTAGDILGHEAAFKLWERATRVYGDKEGYIEGSFRHALTTTTRVVLRYELRYDPARINTYNTDGRYLVDADVWPPEGHTPAMTAAEYEARFPRLDHKNGTAETAEPNDGGLFDRVMAIAERIGA
jgi:hypothetical protein